MLRGLFVTGTDTNVGKTTVSAALMHRYRKTQRLKYWKPVQTGIEIDDDTAAVQTLCQCTADELFTSGVRLPRPLSPHLAARLAGFTISIDDLVQPVKDQSSVGRWIVEGAGGFLVPLNEKELMADLITRLGLPGIVVARSSLGTINHTLLTLQSMRAHKLEVAGVVMVGDRNSENRKAIEHYGAVHVIAEMPHFDPLTAESLQSWADVEMDRDNHLAGYLR